MEDKIEVGEFVRTDEGNIFEFSGYFESGYINSMMDKDWILYGNQEKCCKKHSKNPFKLLESEDIVILEYYVSKYRKRIRRKFEVSKFANLILFKNTNCDFIYNLSKQKFLDGKGYNPKIKFIVTKEQFSSVAYKIEE